MKLANQFILFQSILVFTYTYGIHQDPKGTNDTLSQSSPPRPSSSNQSLMIHNRIPPLLIPIATLALPFLVDGAKALYDNYQEGQQEEARKEEAARKEEELEKRLQIVKASNQATVDDDASYKWQRMENQKWIAPGHENQGNGPTGGKDGVHEDSQVGRQV